MHLTKCICPKNLNNSIVKIQYHMKANEDEEQKKRRKQTCRDFTKEDV
jgi:hypothetical protein